MSFVRVTAPSAMYVLADIKANPLRVTHTDSDNDAGISDIMASVESWLDGPNGAVGRCLLTQTWDYFTGPPTTREIEIQLSPVSAVSSISYYDTDDQLQTFSASNYALLAGDDMAVIRLVNGVSWPSMSDRRDALKVRMVAGYGDAGDVPENIKAAGRMMIAHLYRQREAAAMFTGSFEAVPFGVQDLLSTVRCGWVGA